MFVIGLGGGTGSGKTTVAKKLKEKLIPKSCEILPMDNYYKDMSHIDLEKRRTLNYDHPDIIEYRLLQSHLKSLLSGKTVEIPTYDFVSYVRKPEKILFNPPEVIIVEGIFALYYEDICSLYDLSVYVDAESDIRFIRRLMRDVNERERAMQSVVDQYVETVKPMHDAYVEPTKRRADIIIPKGGFNNKAIDVVVSFVLNKLDGVT
ncbi:MAG: uridine kinase [Thermotogae bacterium]|nr:MAG: uridine kinase [Thermotogota bacterium]